MSARGCLLLLTLLLPACQQNSGSTPSGNLPAIHAVAPAAAAPGAAITIRGTDFAVDALQNTVEVGGAQALVLAATSVEIVCEVPRGLSSGAHSVRVTTPIGTSAAATVQVASAAGPAIHTLVPMVAPAGAALVVNGSGFGATSTATVGGLSATILSVSTTRLELRVPSGARTGQVVVRTGASSSNGVTLFVTTPSIAVPTAPGVHARDYLSRSSFTSLLVEVDWVQGKAPDPRALDLLLQRLTERCDKPVGITIVLSDAIPSPGIARWTRNDLYLTERQHRDHYDEGATKVLYLLYVDRTSDNDVGSSLTLGVAYTATSLAVFKDNTTFYGGTTERRTVVHEGGHILGLVNKGISMQSPHEDTAHAKHDVDVDCVMYYSNRSASTRFDPKCLADMRAAGGR